MPLDRTRRRRHGQRALRVVRSPTRQQHQQLLSETPQTEPVLVLPAAQLAVATVAALETATETPNDDQDADPTRREVPAALTPFPSPTPPPPSSFATTQRLLLAHAQRARHLLSHRSTVEALSRPRRREMLEEIERMKRTMRALEDEIHATTSNVEAMESLAVHLQRITSGLRDPGDGPGAASGSAEALEELRRRQQRG